MPYGQATIVFVASNTKSNLASKKCVRDPGCCGRLLTGNDLISLGCRKLPVMAGYIEELGGNETWTSLIAAYLLCTPSVSTTVSQDHWFADEDPEAWQTA